MEPLLRIFTSLEHKQLVGYNHHLVEILIIHIVVDAEHHLVVGVDNHLVMAMLSSNIRAPFVAIFAIILYLIFDVGASIASQHCNSCL